MTIFFVILFSLFSFRLSDGVIILNPNVTVAGSNNVGTYRTIAEAIEKAPNNSMYRYTIHVKRGTYYEQVVIPDYKPNITIFGDGKEHTIISHNFSEPDYSIQSSPTLRVDGAGFFAVNITVENTAGEKKQQAVAIYSNSRNSAFYQVRIKAYQDTLYIGHGPQFYSESDIHGSVDFIFGEGPAFFQKCKILARQLDPKSEKYNVITANGCLENMSPCGFAFQRCTISGEDKLLHSKSPTPTYLGRPWKMKSTTVIMESDIAGVINPKGWIEWRDKSFENTVFYGEFNNSGPGSVVRNRVKWHGVRPRLLKRTAKKYTASTFLMGTKWLDNLNVSYIPGLF